MKIIDERVIQNVVKILKKEKLFRYDCYSAEESEVATFEREFSELVGSRYAVAMNSCSSALFVSLLCAGVKYGDKVAIPAFTFIAVPSAIVHAGAQPVLIEIDKDYVMDLVDFEAKISDGSVKVLMLSYMRGRAPNLDEVIELCEKYNVTLVEDSAHSLGVLWNGKQTGTFGLAGAYSAQSYKMIDGGEGGVLVTNNKDVAFKAMLYAGCYEKNWKKHFGTDDGEDDLAKLTNTLPAYNFRMSNLTAASLAPQLDQIDYRVMHFNENYQILATLLSTSNRIRLPNFTPGIRPAADSIQWEFVGLSEQQIKCVKEALFKHEIQVEIFSGDNARCFWNWSYFKQNESCDFTRDLIQRTVDMRLRHYLTKKDVETLGEKILEVVGSV